MLAAGSALQDKSAGKLKNFLQLPMYVRCRTCLQEERAGTTCRKNAIRKISNFAGRELAGSALFSGVSTLSHLFFKLFFLSSCGVRANVCSLKPDAKISSGSEKRAIVVRR